MAQSPNPPVKILFVCVGNACRSQMAEAWAKHVGKGKVEAASAGLYPYGSITEDTYNVMGEKGISLDGQCSKGLHDVELGDMEVVVVMGAEVECPLPPGFKGCLVEWEIPDPFGREIAFFRTVRDMIGRKVVDLLAEHFASEV